MLRSTCRLPWVNYCILFQVNDPKGIQCVDDPLQLEQAIKHLVTNLPSPESENSSTSSPRSKHENQDCPSTTDYPYAPKPSHIHIKTASKRPPSTDIGTSTKKRHKDSDVKQSTSPNQTQKENRWWLTML